MCWANGLTRLSLNIFLHCRWADLPALDADTSALAAKLRTQLTGDSAHQYSADDPSEQQQATDDEAGEGGKNVVTEVQRLRFMIDSINKSTAVLPKVRMLVVCHFERPAESAPCAAQAICLAHWLKHRHHAFSEKSSKVSPSMCCPSNQHG